MSDLKIGDPVRLIRSWDTIKNLQTSKGLEKFDYDTFKDITGYVGCIRGDIIQVNYTIHHKKCELIVDRRELDRVIALTYNGESNKKSSVKGFITEATTSHQKIVSRAFTSLIHESNPSLKKLLKTIEEGDVEELKKIIKNNRHINDQDDLTKFTIFHKASAKGDLTILEVVKKSGCNPNAVDIDGDTILHCGVYGNKSLSVAYICRHYPHLTKSKNKMKSTPFLTACHSRKFKIALQLLEIDSSTINNVNFKDNTAIHYVVSCRKDDEDRIILLNAMLKCKHINLSVLNSDGYTAFHIACFKGIESVVRLFVEHCEETKNFNLLNLVSSDKETGAQLALCQAHFTLARFIISKSPTKWSEQGVSKTYGTILHSAIKMACIPLVQQIIMWDEQLVNVVNSKGETPLDLAYHLYEDEVYNRRLDGRTIVKYLKDVGGKIGVSRR